MRHRRPTRNWSLIVGSVLALLIVVVTVFHNVLAPYPSGYSNLFETLSPPSWAHWLGTDEEGRDELSRVIYGFPWTLGVTTIAVAISCSIGVVLGLVAAGWPGWPRFIVRRGVDFAIAFPFLVVALVIIVVVGHGFFPLAVTLGVVAWPLFTRVTLAEGLVVSEKDYVVAARLMGVGPARRTARHILPALMPTILVMTAFLFADLVLIEAALSLLGLGAPLGSATWGNMLADSTQYFTAAPWLLASPAAALILVVVTANLLGDGLAKRAGSRRTSRLRLSSFVTRSRPPAGAPGGPGGEPLVDRGMETVIPTPVGSAAD